MKFMRNRTRKLAVSAGTTALAAAILGLSVATAGPAAATAYIPGSQQTCSSGQPKLDYEYMDVGNYNTLTWSNVCGTGTWTWLGGTQEYWLYAIRMPTSPYHRVWLHQNANGSGATACFYSRNSDIYIQAYFNQYGAWIQTPGNVQVSPNTAPC
jgi:hypothetical protein